MTPYDDTRYAHAQNELTYVNNMAKELQAVGDYAGLRTLAVKRKACVIEYCSAAKEQLEQIKSRYQQEVDAYNRGQLR